MSLSWSLFTTQKETLPFFILMTGYEPYELKKLMRTRLYLSGRARLTFGKTKETWNDLLKQKENTILQFVTDPYRGVSPKWVAKAIETITITNQNE